MQDLRDWLNSNTRTYSVGVLLYGKYGTDASMYNYFKIAETATSKIRLAEALICINNQAKQATPVQEIAPQEPVAKPVVIAPPVTATPIVDALEKTLQHEANTLYKQLMNTRARLFGLCSIAPIPNENTADLVAMRKTLALQVCEAQRLNDRAYEALKYYKKHGTIMPPNASDAPKEKVVPTNNIDLVRAFENERKNLNKLRAKPATSSRVALILQKENYINLLKNAIEHARANNG